MNGLKHYPRGSSEFILDRSRVYNQELRFDKPDGLWVSVKGDDDWLEWCRIEEFGDHGKMRDVEHTVALTCTANVLMLTNPFEIRDFTAEYALPSRNYDYMGDRIDWPRVTGEYDGIIIAPYQWSCRNGEGTFWYYTWDCASGCIWNLDSITSITPTVAVSA